MFDISKIINNDFEREVWKMDTSHYSILQKFLLNSTQNIIDLKEVGDNRYQFFNPSVIKRKEDPGFSMGAITQYARVLVFYNVLSYKDLVNLNCKSWKCVIAEMLEGNVKLTNNNINPEAYLLDNFVDIRNSILEQINSDNDLIRNNAVKILSTMETFINYKNSKYAEDLKVENFNTFIRNYEYDIKAPKPNGTDEGYIDELKNWMKMYDYCEEILTSLFKDENEAIISEEAFNSIGFSEYGYVGEYVYNEYLKMKNIDHEWVSSKDKYSPYDFRVEEDWVEVKTASNKRKKISFNLSWNEYIQHQAKKERYKILYIDGIYNIDLKKIIRNGINDINKLISEYDITFKEITYSELRDYHLSSKGYWVTEK